MAVYFLGTVTGGRSQGTNSFPPSNHIEPDLFDLCLGVVVDL